MSILTTCTRLCTPKTISFQLRAASSTRPLRCGPEPIFLPRRFAHRDAPSSKPRSPEVAKLPRRRTTLQLRNIPRDVPPKKIPEVLSRFGDVKDCVILRDLEGNFSGNAYVEYYLPDHAEEALRTSEEEGIMIHGQPVDAAFFKRSLTTVKPSRTLHVSEMPKDISLGEIRSYFEEHGSITNIRFGRYPGSAYVDFASEEVAEGIMQEYRERPFMMGKRVITVYFAQPSFSIAQPDENHHAEGSMSTTQATRRLNPPTSSIFVTKFAKPMLENDVHEAFKRFGEIQSITLNYYEDRPSRTMAFIHFASVEQATAAIEAWQSGALRHLGQTLRMDYERHPAAHGNAPFHTLRLSGFSGGLPVLETLAREFKESIWRVTEPVAEQGRKGKGASVGYIEFITVDHATAALDALQGRILPGGERLRVAYATPLKAWTLRGGVGRRDYGGEKFAFGVERDEDDRRRDSGAALFHALERKEQWSRLEKIATYLGKEWKAGNEEQAKELVKGLVRKRAQAKAGRQELSRILADVKAKGASQSDKPEEPPSRDA